MEEKIHLTEFGEFKVKRPIKKLSETYSLLHEFSQIIDKFDEKRDLEYFSELYNEIMPVVNTIVIYVVNNNLAGNSKTVDDFVFGSQKILDHLKILHSRYELISKHSMAQKHSDWYSYSKKESGDILNDIEITLRGIFSLKGHHLSY